MDERKEYRAYICCGPTCSLKHSSALVDELQREVDQAGLSDKVEVMPGGCMKHCEQGPSMVVWPGRVYYEFVNIAKLRRIVREHIGAGRPVREFFYTEPGQAQLDRDRARRLEAQRALQQRLEQGRNVRPTPPQQPPSPPNDNRRRNNRPSWRSNDGDVDDFKW